MFLKQFKLLTEFEITHKDFLVFITHQLGQDDGVANIVSNTLRIV